jgi:phosphohistidine phosphatase
MKHVWVLRHAKAAPGEPGGDDRSRPLTARGHRQGAALRARLPELAASERPLPTLVLCSTARRARQTAEEVLDGLGPGTRIELEPLLYTADAGAVVERLRLVPDEVVSVMVVGHNPTLHELCFDLVAAEDEVSRRRLDDGFPTAALAVVGIDAPVWAELVAGAGHLEELVVPER